MQETRPNNMMMQQQRQMNSQKMVGMPPVQPPPAMGLPPIPNMMQPNQPITIA